MAHIQKIQTVQWFIRIPGRKKPKRAAKSTSGAFPKTIESRCWHLFDEGRYIKKLHTDKLSSQKEMTNWITAKERGESGITDKCSQHARSEIKKYVDEFAEEYLAKRDDNISDRKLVIATLRNAINPELWPEPIRLTKSGKPRKSMRQPNQPSMKIRTLREFDDDKISRYLAAKRKQPSRQSKSGKTIAPHTLRKHHSALSLFSEWAFRKRYLRENVIKYVPTPEGKTRIENCPRSLSIDEAKAIVEILNGQSLEWRAIVLLAIQTGLRNAEIAKVTVNDFDLDTGTLSLSDAQTKNNKPACFTLGPILTDLIRQWVVESGRRGADRVFKVPAKACKAFRKLAVAAKLPLETDKGKTQFRSLRKSYNMLMKAFGMNRELRQTAMRHSDSRLTDNVYDDTWLADIAPQTRKFQDHLETALAQ